jgi:hypothetical protein
MTEQVPHEITQRELRNDSGAIMRAVERGKSFTIARNGTRLDGSSRADVDDLIDQDLFGREW